MASGGLKVRAGLRARVGVPLLSAVELLAGAGLTLVSFAAPPAVEVGFRLIVGAIVLLVGSSAVMAARLSRKRRELEDSEGSRLVTYVKYLSRESEIGDGPLPPE